LKYAHLLAVPLLLAACSQLSAVQPPARSAAAPSGQAFAQASCGGCHATGRYGTSPNSNAPPFHVIANQEGLTEQSLSTWLQGAHNYPSEMDFQLGQREVKRLVSYMLTLKSSDYKRPPD
jgi:mono/diheme cytochrome c family protein